MKKWWLLLLTYLWMPVLFTGAIQQHVLSLDNLHFRRDLRHKKKAGEPLTATEALFLKYCLKRAEHMKQYIYDDFVKQVAQIEFDLGEQGYVTFVHGRCWDWHFLNDIWNLICALSDGQDHMSDRISLRQRNKNCNMQQLYDMRKDLIKMGSSVFVWSAADAKSKNAELTFMSRTLLSSEAYTGASYLFENMKWTEGETTAYRLVVKLLEQYNLMQYEPNIKELFELHQQASEWGELLAISIKKDCLDDMVYKAYDGGTRDKRCKALGPFLQQQYNKVKKDDDYLEDEFLVYCFAVSDIPGEYDTKYKIHSIHQADYDLYQQYKKMLQEIFQRIRHNHGQDDLITQVQKKISNCIGWILDGF